MSLSAIIDRRTRLALLLILFLAGCGDSAELPEEQTVGQNPTLPPPATSLIPTVNIAPAKRWAEDQQPQPAAGLAVTAFARDLDHPRWLHVLPNGDVLVAESNAPERPERKGVRTFIMNKVMARAGAGVPSADRITLLRDADGDGVAELRTEFLTGLNSPFGMALVGDRLYVANTDAVVRFPYSEGQTRIDGEGEKVVDLPAGPLNHHWTKGLLASPDGARLYASVGSNSNAAENGIEQEERRAAILEIDVASGESRVFAAGLRNPIGMGWNPATGELWTVVNERDELGSDLVPDYLTSVREGGFYGWPYSYFGQNLDERVEPQRPELVAQAIVPDYALGNHVAPLGMSFAKENGLPEQFADGVFVGLHGSWNRRPHSGYKVIFVPFQDGKPAGQPLDVLTGFLSQDGEALGRPVGVESDGAGGLLVADDVGNVVWRVDSGSPPQRNE
ncbi:PQQ-dependent sugar dehydrogenase [Oceanibaculum pacificum]|uniref:Sorbosone dehydrogenase n=1 Tax=Oceanibaculum pacificum TaxID=580166 RepID=A0A154WEL5_9PROT|nr:sorbosone dehydrogenase family protein [Oceanibaculum pacificum]KZD11971.1 sorbosone dehydrogenase [Oceanibaculum pacificum]